MILQALNDYYERKYQEPGGVMPAYGFSEQKISFVLHLSRNGKLLDVIDIRDGVGSKKSPKLLPVPAPPKRTGNVASNFLWDNTGYVLGVDGKGKPGRTEKTFADFLDRHRELAVTEPDEGLSAVVSFLSSWRPEQAEQLPEWEDMIDTNLVFKIEGDSCYLHERPVLRAVWLNRSSAATKNDDGQCLVTGSRESVAALHPDIKGVRNAQSKGAALVSFNLAAFTSYGKKQNRNAPVGEQAAFGYTTALNTLLRKGSRNRLQVGDATTVFWAERDTPAEDLLGAFLNPPETGNKKKTGKTDTPEDDPETVQMVRDVLAAAKAGRPLGEVDLQLDEGVRFYILGLAPNNARLAVRFWNVSTLGELVARLGTHFRALAIERQYANEPEFLPLWRLLLETATLHKSENVPPLLAGALSRAILTGSPYPRSLFTAVLGRIRADRQVNYPRVSILKACLVRNFAKEIPMALDPQRPEPSYRLGRLFALLEKAQKDAVPGAKATIKDRFFGAASATPRAVFPQLLRTAQHHISKAEYGGYTEKLIAEVIEDIDTFPGHLSLEDQGLFAIGYYHQRNAVYRKSEED